MLWKVSNKPVPAVQTDAPYVLATNADYYLDFRAMVDASVPLKYAKKHFAPALQTVIR